MLEESLEPFQEQVETSLQQVNSLTRRLKKLSGAAHTGDLREIAKGLSEINQFATAAQDVIGKLYSYPLLVRVKESTRPQRLSASRKTRQGKDTGDDAGTSAVCRYRGRIARAARHANSCRQGSVTEADRREQSTPLRAYIRRWITEWDIHRLYPDSAVDIETAEWETDYSENRVEKSSGEEASDQSLIGDVLGDI